MMTLTGRRYQAWHRVQHAAGQYHQPARQESHFHAGRCSRTARRIHASAVAMSPPWIEPPVTRTGITACPALAPGRVTRSDAQRNFALRIKQFTGNPA